ncbi:hypothetical protein Asi03nite_64030 [Actinoplanes siamensis]|uniref:Uncharacterized protein n=1 Tax=Actinoplanes siamensis TaxID=1223317 RepID=A0A919NE07_9ACTN|nr:hypothetical protein [Actinoplanes siamensis]GIF08865.1 hypothetical protein Asi03nite_64030 [Actinoplanes siamensis]
MTAYHFVEAAGPDLIRAGLHDAIATTTEQAGHITALAGPLAEASDFYAGLQMATSTIDCLREASTALTIAQQCLDTAAEHLHAALNDFNARDGRVADAVAETGNLMIPGEGPTHQHSTGHTHAVAGPAASLQQERNVSDSNSGALPDAAGLTGSEHWHGSDVVTAEAGDGTVWLGLCKYPDSDAYVVVATNPPGKSWEPDSDGNRIDPALSKDEAATFADTLDELADLAESGTPTTPPTRLEKLAARMRDLIGATGVTIAGDEGEIQVSAADMRTILDAAVPEPAVATRRRVDAKNCARDNMDTGAVWAQLDTSAAEPVVAVTSTEGEPPEDYPEGYTTTRLSPAEARQIAAKVRRFAATDPQAAAPQHATTAGQEASTPTTEDTVQQVRQAYERLADRPGGYVALTDLRNAVPTKDRERVDQALRQLMETDAVLEPEAFGFRVGAAEQQAAIHIGGEDRHHLAIRTPAVSSPAAAVQARRITSPRGQVYEYDPGTGATAVIEPDGWRAVVPARSASGAAAQLLYWQAQIQDGRGEDAAEPAARDLLKHLSAAELREVAVEIGAPDRGARTRPQLINVIVTAATRQR